MPLPPETFQSKQESTKDVSTHSANGDGDGCVCPYAEVNEQVQAGYDDQTYLPEPSNIDKAASRHDKETQHGKTDVLDPVEDDRVQRILPIQPSHIPEESLYQNVEETPEDPVEDLTLPTTSVFHGALEESFPTHCPLWKVS